MVFKNYILYSRESFFDCIGLSNDVNTIFLTLYHSLNASNLALDNFEPPSSFFLNILSRVYSIPYRGIMHYELYESHEDGI
jgi:hypothetical protein